MIVEMLNRLSSLKRLGVGLILITAILAWQYKAELRGLGSAKPADGLKLAPDFTLERSNGEKIHLASLRDHVVVVHFWASWCAPCIPEIPEILAAAKKLPKDQVGRPIHWILVSQDETWEKAHSIVKEETLPENVVLVLDPKTEASDLFGSYQFPETYLILRDRGLAAKWIGAQEWTGKWGDEILAGIESASRFNRLPKGNNP